jgi:TPR repeat protein
MRIPNATAAALLAAAIPCIALISTIAVIPTRSATSGSYEDIAAAQERGDQAEVVNLLRPLADQGNAVAQYNLGWAYRNGSGVPQDLAQSMAWYRKAADQGHAGAQHNIGVAYRDGRGVPQDLIQAMTWFRKAADQGHAGAQTNLGAMYAGGEGTPQDHTQAAAWYRKAADQGHAVAQTNLGWAYYHGRGVPQNHAQAAALFRKAADQGFAGAQDGLGVAYYYGHGVPQDFVQAAAWFRKAVDQGHAGAQAALGAMYADGQGVPRDRAVAVRLLRTAAAAGNETARTELARVEAEQMTPSSGRGERSLSAPAPTQRTDRPRFAEGFAFPSGLTRAAFMASNPNIECDEQYCETSSPPRALCPTAGYPCKEVVYVFGGDGRLQSIASYYNQLDWTGLYLWLTDRYGDGERRTMPASPLVRMRVDTEKWRFASGTLTLSRTDGVNIHGQPVARPFAVYINLQ